MPGHTKNSGPQNWALRSDVRIVRQRRDGRAATSSGINFKKAGQQLDLDRRVKAAAGCPFEPALGGFSGEEKEEDSGIHREFQISMHSGGGEG